MSVTLILPITSGALWMGSVFLGSWYVIWSTIVERATTLTKINVKKVSSKYNVSFSGI